MRQIVSAAVLVSVAAVVGLGWWWASTPASQDSSRSARAEVGNSPQSRLTPSQSPLDAVASPAIAPTIPKADTAPRPQMETAGAPLDVSPGFETLLSPAQPAPSGSMGALILQQHAKLSSEPYDPAWEGRVDSGVREFVENALTQRGLDPNRIDLSVIECRTSLCEIQATGPREDSMQPFEFQFLVQQVVKGPLANEFDGRAMIINMHEIPGGPGGRIGYLVLLPRKEP